MTKHPRTWRHQDQAPSPSASIAHGISLPHPAAIALAYIRRSRQRKLTPFVAQGSAQPLFEQFCRRQWEFPEFLSHRRAASVSQTTCSSDLTCPLVSSQDSAWLLDQTTHE